MEGKESKAVSFLNRFSSSPSYPAVLIAFGAFVAMAESLSFSFKANQSKMQFGPKLSELCHGHSFFENMLA